LIVFVPCLFFLFCLRLRMKLLLVVEFQREA
jgi:hypothetical protein